MPTIAMPPVTDQHRQAAFVLLAMRGWTFEAAMRDELRRRVIEALAAHLRTREWKASHAQRARIVRRLDPTTGRWASQHVAGDHDSDQRPIEETTP